MTPNDTQPPLPPATARGRTASITDIGEALQRKRTRSHPTQADTAESPVVGHVHRPPLEIGDVIGYFQHAGHCIQVQHAAAEALWLRERAYDARSGALPDFAAYADLRYWEFATITWRHRTLQFTYIGDAVEPTWMAMPSASQADLMRKVFSLYDGVTKGSALEAADNLVPNPSPQRFDPNRGI